MLSPPGPRQGQRGRPAGRHQARQPRGTVTGLLGMDRVLPASVKDAGTVTRAPAGPRRLPAPQSGLPGPPDLASPRPERRVRDFWLFDSMCARIPAAGRLNRSPAGTAAYVSPALRRPFLRAARRDTEVTAESARCSDLAVRVDGSRRSATSARRCTSVRVSGRAMASSSHMRRRLEKNAHMLRSLRCLRRSLRYPLCLRLIAS